MDQRPSLKSGSRKTPSSDKHNSKKVKKKRKSRKIKHEQSPNSCSLEIEGEGLTAGESGGEFTSQVSLQEKSNEVSKGSLILETSLKEKSSTLDPSVQTETQADIQTSQVVSGVQAETGVDSLATKLSHVSVKTKNSRRVRNKVSLMSTKSLKTFGKSSDTDGKVVPSNSSFGMDDDSRQRKLQQQAESLRWETALDDPEAEQERLQIYKLNRRKRYLAAAQAKGLAWALNYSSTTPLFAEDVGHGSVRSTNLSSVIDFSSLKTLRPNQSVINSGIVDCT